MKFDATVTIGFIVNIIVLISTVGVVWGSLKTRMQQQDESRMQLYEILREMERTLIGVNERLARLEGRYDRSRGKSLE